MKRFLSMILAAIIAANLTIVNVNAIRSSDTDLGEYSTESEDLTLSSVLGLEADASNFDPYIYMADNILSGSTPAGKSFNFYSNEVDTIADIFKGSVTPEFEAAVGVWETTNLALKPEDIPQKAIDAKG